MTSAISETLYFKINGGTTILQKDNQGWARWDTRDGFVRTSIDWDNNLDRIEQLSYKEALPHMK